VEWFVYLCQRYNVAKAWRMAQAWSPEERKARLVKHPLPLATLETIIVDVEKAMSPEVDLSVPLLVLQGKNPSGSEWKMVIDGWHRIYKASQEGKRKLPAFLFTVEESEEIIKG
jgi:hypothetical protein